MTRTKSNPLLLISFLDPTSSSGLVHEALTVHRLGKSCLTVCHAIANQNEVEVDDYTLLSFEEIKRQLDAIGRKYWIDWVSISGIQDLTLTAALIRYLKQSRPGIHVLWAPVLRHPDRIYHQKLTLQEEELLIELCQKCHTVILQAADFILLSETLHADTISPQGNVYLLGKEHQQDVLYTLYKSEVYHRLPESAVPSFLPALSACLYEGLSIVDATAKARAFLLSSS